MVMQSRRPWVFVAVATATLVGSSILVVSNGGASSIPTLQEDSLFEVGGKYVIVFRERSNIAYACPVRVIATRGEWIQIAGFDDETPSLEVQPCWYGQTTRTEILYMRIWGSPVAPDWINTSSIIAARFGGD